MRTTKRITILSELISRERRGAWPPTVRELRDAAGLRSLSGVTYHLDGLADAGLIERGERKARAVRLVDDEGPGM